MDIKIKKTHDKAAWRVATEGAAGIDFAACSIDYINLGTQAKYGLGVSIEIPSGHVGLLVPRSSVVRRGLLLSNSVGVIDSDYRGELSVVFEIRSVSDIYRPGEYVCQLIILPLPQINIIESASLSETQRGSGGYGSTGN